MSIQAQITAKLEREFSPTHLEVINESGNHNVPPGSETHFKVIIVSDVFNQLGRVPRQQKVYACLAEELREGVHALSQHTYTAVEWALVGREALISPECKGGGK